MQNPPKNNIEPLINIEDIEFYLPILKDENIIDEYDEILENLLIEDSYE